MKNLLQILWIVMVTLHIGNAQSRGKIAQPNPPDSRVDVLKLKSLFNGLEDMLTCNESLTIQDRIFLTPLDAQRYANGLLLDDHTPEEKNRIKAIGDFFYNHSNSTKSILLADMDRFAGLEYYGFRTRPAMNPEQIVIITSFNIVHTDLSKESIRLNVIDVAGEYRIINIEE